MAYLRSRGGMMLLSFVCLLFHFSSVFAGWGSDKILLKDVEVLTLRSGQYTTGRRSAPVPQLKCIGGTGGCSYAPKVVQCYNRGSDGTDVQWECKAELDKSVGFGDVEVMCEGYSYPDDPYVLTGSCGLEYTLDLKRGGSRKSDDNNAYSSFSNDYGWKKKLHKGSESNFFNGLVLVCMGAFFIYVLFKICIDPRSNRSNQRSNTNDDYPYGGPGRSPPPPGFRPNYYNSGWSDPSEGSCGSGRNNSDSSFWTGAATGGVLGYLFGSRNSYNTGGPMPSTSSGFSSFTSNYGRDRSSSPSTGSTETSSGFGSTRRR